MQSNFVLFSILISLNSFVLAVDKTVNAAQVASLKTAASALDRQAILSKDSDWTFDFFAQKSYTYSPGSVVNANAATFPALAAFDMALAYLNLGPCAMLPLHHHPRATNLVVAIEGSTDTYMLEENGARVIKERLTPGKMTIFPKGALHTMQNTKCTNATLISALSSSDPGTQNLVNSMFGMPEDLVRASLGDGARNFNFDASGSQIPPVGTGSILGSAECRKRCGL